MCWEDAVTLRFGFDNAIVRLHRPTAEAQRFISMLRKGVLTHDLRDASRRAGLGLAEHERVLTALKPVLNTEIERTQGTTPPPRTVAVHGTGTLARVIEHALNRCNYVICDASTAPSFAVVIERFLEPAAEAHHLLIDGIPHLALRVSDASATLGPLVNPGGAPCLSCVELHGLQQDPLAPFLAAQLLLDATPLGSKSCFEALAALVVAIIDEWHSDPTAFTGSRLRFDVTAGRLSLFPTVEAITPHDACGCVTLSHSAEIARAA